jgi:hypothetical protein
VIEVPILAASLTLNKGDFIRTGPRGAVYLSARKAIQEVVQRQLALWGDAREQPEPTPPRSVRAMERDLERVLLELSEGFPLLAALVEQRRGGQKRLPLGQQGNPDDDAGFGPSLFGNRAEEPGLHADVVDAPGGVQADPAQPVGQSPTERPPRSESPPDGAVFPLPRAAKRPVRLGLAVKFEDRPEDPELGRLLESTVFINQAHPAYRRAAASRSEGYHIALAVALALAPLAVEAAGEHAFVTTFLARWGEAVSSPTRYRGKS